MISFRHLKIKSSRVRIIIPKILEKFKSLSKRVDIADKKVYNIRINFYGEYNENCIDHGRLKRNWP